MVKPVVVADHIMQADRHGAAVLRRGKLTKLIRRRHADHAFLRERAEHGERFGVLPQNVVGDGGDHFDHFGRMDVVPGAHRLGEPARGANHIEHVAQQQQVDPLDGAVAAVEPRAGADGEVGDSFDQELKRPGGNGLAAGAVGEVQVADNHQHRSYSPKLCAARAARSPDKDSCGELSVLGVLKLEDCSDLAEKLGKSGKPKAERGNLGRMTLIWCGEYNIQ
jgi:hypothetical protein